MIDLQNLKKEQIGLLHRQWMWADYIRKTYESTMKTTSKDILLNPSKFYAYPIGCYMCLWYALTFSVLERLKNWRIRIDNVQPEIDEVYPSLKELRHAVFHAPLKYWDMRWFESLKIEGFGNKIRKIHHSIGNLLLETMKTRMNNKSS